VALVGSVFSSLFGPQVLSTLSKLRLSHHQLIVARGSLAAAQATVAHFPSTIRALRGTRGLTNAFIEGFHPGLSRRGCCHRRRRADGVPVPAQWWVPQDATS